MNFLDFNTCEFEEKFYYDGNDLGAVYSKDATTFKVWAPTAEKVSLCLYTKGSPDEAGDSLISEHDMLSGDKGIFSHTEAGDLDGIYYTYKVTVDGKTQETVDIYANAGGVNSLRSMVIDLSRTDPKDWENDVHVTYPLEDTQIWEVHVGDFSNDPASGVKAEHRGKFLAFTENDTTLNNEGNFPTCMNYLKDSGITHIHLLPSFDYGSIDERYESTNINWGYDPVCYNVPEGSYSTNAFDGAVRIREFKEMVQAMHKAGLSVVMDVVYNHTYSLDSAFEKTVPGYYYRQDKDGTYCNGSCCGNDTASDRAMFSKFMIDSVLYWAREYHVDGFRFDLMGLHDTRTINTIRAELNKLGDFGPSMIVYGEPWSAGPSAFRDGAIPCTKAAVNELADGILIFNDDIRDAIKGPFDQLDVPGFINGHKNMEAKVSQVIPGGFDVEFSTQPASAAKLINYVSAHDNSTLWDKLVDSVLKDNSYTVRNEKLIAMNKLAATIVQFSKGVPFIQAGEEAARTKLGEDNSYNLGKDLNWLDWKRMSEYTDLIDYYKGLRHIRSRYADIRSLSTGSSKSICFFNTAHDDCIGYTCNDLTIIYNASDEPFTYKLDSRSKLLVHNGDISPENTIAEGEIIIPPISAFAAVKC